MRAALRSGLWASVAVLVAAAHVAAVEWVARRDDAGLPVPPDAIAIEMVPAPAPAAQPEAETPPDPLAEAEAEPEPEPETETPAEPPPEAVAAPEFTPPPVVPLPPPDFASLMPKPEVKQPEAKAAEPPRPDRKKPEPKKRETPKAEPKKRAPAPAAPEQTASRSQRAAPAAPGGAARGANPAATASWQQNAGARISAHMARARISGARGAVRVTVIIGVDGHGRASGRLAGSTGDSRIDAALTRQAARLPTLPPPPGGRPVQFTLPVSIALR